MDGGSQTHTHTHIYTHIQMHPDISVLEETGRKRRLQKSQSWNVSCSEQEVSDGGEQLGQLRLDVVGLSDGVAAEIKMLQLGAGGQWLKICQAGDFCASELKRTPLNGDPAHPLGPRGREGVLSELTPAFKSVSQGAAARHF